MGSAPCHKDDFFSPVLLLLLVLLVLLVLLLLLIACLALRRSDPFDSNLETKRIKRVLYSAENIWSQTA